MRSRAGDFFMSQVTLRSLEIGLQQGELLLPACVKAGLYSSRYRGGAILDFAMMS